MVEQMKPSGIYSVGDIPQSWLVSKVKYNTLIPLTDGPHETPVFVDDGIPFYSVDGIQDDKIVYEPCRYISIEDANRFDIKVKPRIGDILMGKAASVGKIAIIDKDIRLQVWSPLAVIRADETKVNNRFLRYYLLSSAAQVEIDLKSTSNTQKNIAMEDIQNITIIKPKIKEQLLIADFLDTKCGKINGIISDLEKQIDTLQKYKMSLITETVTKGLDKSATMKDSKVSIIGKIKANWEIKKLKYIVSTPITDGPHETPVLLDDGIPFLSAESVKNGVLDFDYKRGYISETDHRIFCKKIKPQKGDIFVVKSGATTGNVGRVTTDEEFSIWSPLALIRCDNKTILQDFIYYCTLSNYFRQEVELSWSYGTQQNIGMGVLGNLNIVIPSAAEQAEIVKFLDCQCGKIDSILKDKQEQLEKIKQHKKSLIYEYVTGKKRVKEATNGN